MKQYRIVGLGDWHGYYSHFLHGILEGTIRNRGWFRPVYLFQGLDEIEMQIRWFRPHLIIGHMYFNKRPHEPRQLLKMLGRIREMGTKVAYHMGDAKIVSKFPDDISKFVDFALVNHTNYQEIEKAWGVPCHHWPYMCFQQNGGEKKAEFEKKVVFTGSLDDGKYHGARKIFIEKLRKEIEVTTFPNSQVGNTRFMTADVSMSAGCVLGVQMEPQINGYLDVRPFQYIGSGALYFQDRCEAMDRVFKPDYHYVSYRTGSVEDFITKYKYYVEEHPEEGEKIRLQGRRFCQNYHSTKERVKFAMDIAEGKEVTNRIYLKDLPE